jgi:hypothetical protein
MCDITLHIQQPQIWFSISERVNIFFPHIARTGSEAQITFLPVGTVAHSLESAAAGTCI